MFIEYCVNLSRLYTLLNIALDNNLIILLSRQREILVHERDTTEHIEILNLTLSRPHETLSTLQFILLVYISVYIFKNVKKCCL